MIRNAAHWMLIGACSVAMVACTGDQNADGGDVTTDVRDSSSDIITDGGGDIGPDVTTDVGTDVGSDVVVDAGSDAGDDVATDVPVDAPVCPSTPLTYQEVYAHTFLTNTVGFIQADGSGVGGPPAFVLPTVSIADAMADVPPVISGDCTRARGGMRAMVPNPLDEGTISAMHGSLTATLTFDPSIMDYVPSSLDAWSIMPGTALSLTFPATEGGAGGAGSVIAPQHFDASSFMSPLFDPSNPVLSRAAPTTITWTPVADTDSVMHLEIRPQAGGPPTIVCGVRACSGSLTIPADISALYPDGTAVQVQVYVTRIAPISGVVPATNAIVGSSAAFAAVAM